MITTKFYLKKITFLFYFLFIISFSLSSSNMNEKLELTFLTKFGEFKIEKSDSNEKIFVINPNENTKSNIKTNTYEIIFDNTSDSSISSIEKYISYENEDDLKSKSSVSLLKESLIRNEYIFHDITKERKSILVDFYSDYAGVSRNIYVILIVQLKKNTLPFGNVLIENKRYINSYNLKTVKLYSDFSNIYLFNIYDHAEFSLEQGVVLNPFFEEGFNYKLVVCVTYEKPIIEKSEIPISNETYQAIGGNPKFILPNMNEFLSYGKMYISIFTESVKNIEIKYQIYKDVRLFFHSDNILHSFNIYSTKDDLFSRGETHSIRVNKGEYTFFSNKPIMTTNKMVENKSKDEIHNLNYEYKENTYEIVKYSENQLDSFRINSYTVNSSETGFLIFSEHKEVNNNLSFELTMNKVYSYTIKEKTPKKITFYIGNSHSIQSYNMKIFSKGTISINDIIYNSNQNGDLILNLNYNITKLEIKDNSVNFLKLTIVIYANKKLILNPINYNEITELSQTDGTGIVYYPLSFDITEKERILSFSDGFFKNIYISIIPKMYDSGNNTSIYEFQYFNNYLKEEFTIKNHNFIINVNKENLILIILYIGQGHFSFQRLKEEKDIKSKIDYPPFTLSFGSGYKKVSKSLFENKSNLTLYNRSNKGCLIIHVSKTNEIEFIVLKQNSHILNESIDYKYIVCPKDIDDLIIDTQTQKEPLKNSLILFKSIKNISRHVLILKLFPIEKEERDKMILYISLKFNDIVSLKNFIQNKKNEEEFVKIKFYEDLSSVEIDVMDFLVEKMNVKIFGEVMKENKESYYFQFESLRSEYKLYENNGFVLFYLILFGCNALFMIGVTVYFGLLKVLKYDRKKKYNKNSAVNIEESI